MRLFKIRTFAHLVAVIRDSYFLTPSLRQLRSHFAKADQRNQGQKPPVILIQCVEDYFYFALFGKIAARLRACGPVRVDQFTLRSLRWGSILSLRQMFWNRVRQNVFSDWKWRRLYSGFADRTAYRATGWLTPWTALHLWWTAWRLWRSLKTVDGLAQLTVNGIWIGDLIIDSYIRFKPAVTPALNDPYLLIVVRQAIKDIWKASRYFRRNKPALLLTSYTTYIQHGVPARVAVQQGVPVRAFSNYQEFEAKITRDNLWHTRDGRNYKRDFLALPDHAEKIAAAERELSDRMSGKIDAATSYMKVPAYGRAGGTDISVRGMPVIFLHDFYDSVHIYRWICFHDFWNWACFTIDTLRAAGIHFAVKPHPNQVAVSSDVLNQLMEKYPDLNVIPREVTNDQLIRSGMACAITVYGTVASEMAFMGIPTISCGDNPHVSFDFCHTAQTQQEYAGLLVNCRNLPGTASEMRKESCMFYYMHNLNLDADQMALKNKILQLRRRMLVNELATPAQEVIEAADEFAAGPELQAHCASLYKMIQNKAGDAPQMAGAHPVEIGVSAKP